MDFIHKSGIKIPNAVIFSGVTQVADQGKQVLDFLKKYGSIARIFSINDTSSKIYQNLIFEYSSGSALENLEPLLPYRYTMQGGPCVSYCVRALSSVYTTQDWQ